MELSQFTYHVIKTARDGVETMDKLRRDAGISQMRMAELLDDPDAGMRQTRLKRNGSCQLWYMVKELEVLGWELVMVKKEEKNGVTGSND